MFYNPYQPKPREQRAFDEKAWKRGNLETWETKWHQLDAATRLAFLTQIKAPTQRGNKTSVSVLVNTLSAPVLRNLVAAGFVEVRLLAKRERVFVVDDVLDFTTRLRSAHRYHLLDAEQPSELEKYVKYCFQMDGLWRMLQQVLQAGGVLRAPPLENILQRYLVRQRWPRWALQKLKDPLAERLVTVFVEAPGPIPLAELSARLPGTEPAAVRAAVNQLLSHLVLFEDLQPNTWELMVGLLPAVREDWLRAQQPRHRPPLQVCETPRGVGPEGGIDVSDLRVFLLEAVSEPPRLRQNDTIYQKEWQRFQSAFEPLPDWLTQTLKLTFEKRLNQALFWAKCLGLVQPTTETGESRLHLTKKGRQWLAATVDQQYDQLYDYVRSSASLDDLYPQYAPGDSRFLGSDISAVRAARKDRQHPYDDYDYWTVTPEDREALREAVYQALAVLPMGVFNRLDSVLAHLVFEQHNPLLRGLAKEKVTVRYRSRPVPPLEEELEEAGRWTLEALIYQRLIPLGGIQVAVDAQDQLHIARQPRLDSYFGHEPTAAAPATVSGGEPRVVVQPDFSIVIIGLNTAPAAELAPFCERIQGHAGQGALVLKLTRDAVIKAVTHGLEPAEIVARLKRHASNELPGNVLHEVQEWCAWVRQVSVMPLTVIRCADRATADRVTSALGRQVERLTDTLVALPQKVLTAAERNKLRSQGIIVQSEKSSAKVPARKRQKHRRR